MFHICEIFYCCPVFNGHRILVYTFVHPIIPHYLGPVKAAVIRREGNLYSHLQSPRIIAGVGTGVNCSREIRNSHLFQPFGWQPGRGHSHIKYLCNGCSYRTLICLNIAKHHIVCHYTGLTVGRTRKEIQPRLAGNRVRIFYSITHCIYRFIRSLQIFIYINSTHIPQFQSCLLSQSRLCPHPYRKQHQVRFQFYSRLKMHLQPSILTGK